MSGPERGKGAARAGRGRAKERMDGDVERIEAAFRDAGVTGYLHALDVDSGREIGLRSDEPVVLASVFKVPLLVTFFRHVAAGRLDPAAQVTLRPEDRCAGPTGVSALQDEVRMSLRDLACMMITISDNAAADALFAAVGLDAIDATVAELGLRATRVVGTGRDLHEAMLADGGVRDLGELWARLAEPGVLERLRALDPMRTSRSTPREMARLMAMIWRDEAAPPAECAQMRRFFGLQVWPHRLSSGFPYDDVRVSGKTGTLPTIRNEIGVVEYPDGGRYAVAVFTRSPLPAAVLPQADAVIGTSARLAVEALRRPRQRVVHAGA
ncbi:serine hydrolase [Actinomadura rubrobrunea]|uniref:Serine hydrolase n=1 Tax=Actinomadura rubrobrunea TaxID=115335 RepID=A0A9W6PP14_9ACTN|nr:serine hydrolase [Actinomadura rubrobrunea]GLW62024.1 serine hydrolase [Actinomadura rubrobrunea]